MPDAPSVGVVGAWSSLLQLPEGVDRISFTFPISPKPGSIRYPRRDGGAPARGGEPVGRGIKTAGLSSRRS